MLYIDLYGEEIAEFWRHLAGPDHFSLDPMQCIEHNKLELCAFTKCYEAREEFPRFNGIEIKF